MCIQYFLIIVAAYVLSYGITAFLITPVQSMVLPEITVFASLVYLPHGVRVLATWMWGWRAVFPLYVGGLLSGVLFLSGDTQVLLSPQLFLSVAVGATAALIAFEAMKVLGLDPEVRGDGTMNWKRLLAVGAVASVVNSIGTSWVFSTQILPGSTMPVLATYAIGDVIGLFVSMLVLMLIFRWIRLSGS